MTKKCLMLAAAIFLSVVGCDENYGRGKVIAKTYVPAHTDTTTILMPMGDTGMLVPLVQSDYTPAKIELTIDREGPNKAVDKIRVSEEVGRQYEVGRHYP